MNTFILIVLGQIVSLFGNAALRFALPQQIQRHHRSGHAARPCWNADRRRAGRPLP